MIKFLTIILLFTNSIIFSQKFGNYTVENSTTYTNDTKFINNKWYNSKDLKLYIKSYNQTPIGIKNVLSDVNYILNVNEVSFDNTFIDQSYLSSIVKSIDDYEMLNISIENESSVVIKQWRITDFTYLYLSLQKDSYKLTLLSL